MPDTLLNDADVGLEPALLSDADVGLEPAELPPLAEPTPREFEGRMLRSELAGVRGEDKFAKWYGSGSRLLPMSKLQGSMDFLQPIGGTYMPPVAPIPESQAPPILQAGHAAVGSMLEAISGATEPSTLPVLPLALVPGGPEAMGLYFGGQSLGTGIGEIVEGIRQRDPRLIGSGIGQ